jgi:hypothetical protein
MDITTFHEWKLSFRLSCHVWLCLYEQILVNVFHFNQYSDNCCIPNGITFLTSETIA